MRCRHRTAAGPWRRGRGVVAVLAATLLAACSFGAPADEPSLEPSPLAEDASTARVPPEPALARYYEQELAWDECRDDLECAEVEVPRDYADPAGESLTLAVLRMPAEHEDHAIGALLVNPGGPGVSGMDYAASARTYFGAEVRAAYDIVGFDPRGVGDSTAVDCLSDERLDAFVASDPDPDTPGEQRESNRLLREFGDGCVARSGSLASQVSTEDAARDIDVLRAVLDQERLAYFGASYGTYLGATYADLFPDRVGRLVLDGAVDPSLGSVETGLVQAEGFEVALRAYLSGCVDDGDCYLGATVEEARTTIADFLEDLDAEPIDGGGERELTQGLALYGIWAPLYSRDAWSILDEALSRGLEGDGRILLAVADSYLGRGPDGYINNAWEALYAINCTDPHDPISVRRARALEDQFLEVSPTFGRTFALSLASCAFWPVDAPTERPVLDAPGADPILVVGTTRDPATPLAWAEALAEQLSSGVLLRRDGDGHTGYRSGNECVDDTVEAYLVSGVVPEGTVDC